MNLPGVAVLCGIGLMAVCVTLAPGPEGAVAAVGASVGAAAVAAVVGHAFGVGPDKPRRSLPLSPFDQALVDAALDGRRDPATLTAAGRAAVEEERQRRAAQADLDDVPPAETWGGADDLPATLTGQLDEDDGARQMEQDAAREGELLAEAGFTPETPAGPPCQGRHDPDCELRAPGTGNPRPETPAADPLVQLYEEAVQAGEAPVCNGFCTGGQVHPDCKAHAPPVVA